MVIGNATELCDGTITRKRKTVDRIEVSVLDYFVMCQELFQLLNSMKIDEERTYILSKYSKLRGQTIVTQSDHNVLYCKFNQKWISKLGKENARYEIFNFKNSEGIKVFHELTSSNTLSKCFKNKNVIKESNLWLKELQNIIHRSFKKIRITKPRQNDDVLNKMKEKACILEKLQNLERCLKFVNKKTSQEII